MRAQPATAIEEIEEVAGALSIRVHLEPRVRNSNGTIARGGFSGFRLSPSIERARAAREPKPVQPTTTTAKPIKLPACAPVRAPLPEITNYDTLILCFRARADELQISRETISELAGLPERYANKILSLRHVRRIGLESLGPLLGALGMKLVAIPDGAALARNAAEYGSRDEAHLKSATARWERPADTPTRRSSRSRK